MDTNPSPRKTTVFLPFLFSMAVVLGIFLGNRLSNQSLVKVPFFSLNTQHFNKLNEVMNYISQEYVDSVDKKILTENAIESMLLHLDPHSTYIPAEEAQAANESLEGNFDGIGVEFHIQDDTILVVSPIAGGPSEALGIKPGDRIITIEGKNVAGIGITNNEVMLKLRGPGGTKVNISVLRRGMRTPMNFTITRGKIPIFSVEASYMLTPTAGYIKISRFAATTHDEFRKALLALKKRGLRSLVLDLRGNPGGYLNEATELADEFLGDKKMIVYTKGRSRPRTPYYATARGSFETGRLVVLIDEGSASASEIVSGALQDWDRATIVGRRSFGKGLVQEPTVFPDGSALRLTIARYYTPTGRCIQKSYSGGTAEYQHELADRMQHGEFENADSIRFADSLKFRTPSGKIVFGGGGIMPDVFVPLDTSSESYFLSEVVNKGLVMQFAYDYVDRHRTELEHRYSSFDNYKANFSVNDEIFNEFIRYAKTQGISGETLPLKTETIIRIQIKAIVARQFWKNDGFYQVLGETDTALKKAIELLQKPGSN